MEFEEWVNSFLFEKDKLHEFSKLNGIVFIVTLLILTWINGIGSPRINCSK